METWCLVPLPSPALSADEVSFLQAVTCESDPSQFAAVCLLRGILLQSYAVNYHETVGHPCKLLWSLAVSQNAAKLAALALFTSPDGGLLLVTESQLWVVAEGSRESRRLVPFAVGDEALTSTLFRLVQLHHRGMNSIHLTAGFSGVPCFSFAIVPGSSTAICVLESNNAIATQTASPSASPLRRIRVIEIDDHTLGQPQGVEMTSRLGAVRFAGMPRVFVFNRSHPSSWCSLDSICCSVDVGASASSCAWRSEPLKMKDVLYVGTVVGQVIRLPFEKKGNSDVSLDGSERRTLRVPLHCASPITTVCPQPGGAIIVVGTARGCIAIFCDSSEACLFILPHQDTVRRIARVSCMSRQHGDDSILVQDDANHLYLLANDEAFPPEGSMLLDSCIVPPVLQLGPDDGVFLPRDHPLLATFSAPLEEDEHFQYLATLGSGACGEVVMARSRVSKQRYFAVKRIQRPESNFDEEIHMEELRLIHQEMATVRRVPHHPSIIKYYGSYTSKTHFSVAMDLAPDGNFEHLLFSQGHPPQECLVRAWLAQLLAGLAHLHAHRIMHRDVKPANVLLTSRGHVVWADFGVSAVMQTAATVERTVIGTAAYAAPEVLSHWGVAATTKYSTSADIWSLGAMFYCAALQRREGMVKTHSQLAQVALGKYLPLRDIGAPYSNELVQIIDDMMQWDPHARPRAASLLENGYFCPIPNPNVAYDHTARFILRGAVVTRLGYECEYESCLSGVMLRQHVVVADKALPHFGLICELWVQQLMLGFGGNTTATVMTPQSYFLRSNGRPEQQTAANEQWDELVYEATMPPSSEFELLLTVLSRSSCNDIERTRILHEVAAAVRCLHGATFEAPWIYTRIVHGAVSEWNVWIAQGGAVKLGVPAFPNNLVTENGPADSSLIPFSVDDCAVQRLFEVFG